MDKICYIVGAGEDCGLDLVPESGDLVIAADGGYAALRAAGIAPHVVIGDFDSLGAAPKEDVVITLPTVKDVTDTYAAIDYAMQRGFETFYLYGCTGGRIDHTIANIQIAADLAEKGRRCLIFGKTQIITAVSSETVTFSEESEGFLSVFAHSDVCKGVSLKGLKYELDGAELTNGFPLGVSNAFIGKKATVTIGSGTAILVYDRKNRMAH
ncbi:MAG: thiamine diphosphokinase [Oscillospiraceae bacterium]|nr:thiamine diphosphokinase [Oscillospiraceae bacterium]